MAAVAFCACIVISVFLAVAARRMVGGAWHHQVAEASEEEYTGTLTLAVIGAIVFAVGAAAVAVFWIK